MDFSQEVISRKEQAGVECDTCRCGKVSPLRLGLIACTLGG
jgi:hypothetical protein